MADVNDAEYELYVKKELETASMVKETVDEITSALRGQLRDLVLRLAKALPPGVRWPRPGVSLSDILRDVERYWEREHGTQLSADEQRQKTRMIRDATQLHNESRELYRSFADFIEDVKFLIAAYEKDDRVWQIATKIAARDSGDTEAVKAVNRAARRPRSRGKGR